MEQLAYRLFALGERGRSSDLNDVAANVASLAAHILRHAGVDLDDVDNEQGVVLWGFEVSVVDDATVSVSPGAAVLPASAGVNAGRLVVATAEQQLGAIPATAPAGARTDVVELAYGETDSSVENREIRSIVGGVPVITPTPIAKVRAVTAVAGRGEGRTDAAGGSIRLATISVDETGVTGTSDMRRHFLPAHGLASGPGWKGVQSAIDTLAALAKSLDTRLDNIVDEDGRLLTSLESAAGGDPVGLDAVSLDLNGRSLEADNGIFDGFVSGGSTANFVAYNFNITALSTFQDGIVPTAASVARIGRAVGTASMTLAWNGASFDFDAMDVHAHFMSVVRHSAGYYTVTLDHLALEEQGMPVNSGRYAVQVNIDPYVNFSGAPAPGDVTTEAQKMVLIHTYQLGGASREEVRVRITLADGVTQIDRSFNVVVRGPVL